jgi:hypothetical protein
MSQLSLAGFFNPLEVPFEEMSAFDRLDNGRTSLFMRRADVGQVQ